MSHVFISYSRKDIDAANYVADHLRQRGADVFVDYLRLNAGENFPERLAAEIEQSDAVVFLLSQHSAVSPWVRDEIQYARHCQKKIIPVALDSTEMPRALFFLTAVERVDFTRWQTDRQVEAAAAKLVTALGLPVQPSPPAPLPKGEGRKPPPETRAGFKPAPTTPLQLPDLSAILPPPFEWCPIPAGQVTLEEGGYVPKGGQTFDVPAFAMAKYPITNAQFDVFVKAKDGYADPQWWDYSDDAKAWREKNATPEAPAFGGVGDHPRVNVTWYEAAAFCRWLNWKALTLNPSLFDG